MRLWGTLLNAQNSLVNLHLNKPVMAYFPYNCTRSSHTMSWRRSTNHMKPSDACWAILTSSSPTTEFAACCPPTWGNIFMRGKSKTFTSPQIWEWSYFVHFKWQLAQWWLLYLWYGDKSPFIFRSFMSFFAFFFSIICLFSTLNV